MKPRAPVPLSLGASLLLATNANARHPTLDSRGHKPAHPSRRYRGCPHRLGDCAHAGITRGSPEMMVAVRGVGLLGGLGVSIGACLPWMSLYAGLVSLRGVIGLNGRLLLAAGVLGVALGGVLARGNLRGQRVVFRRLAAGLGIGVIGAAIWLLIGVGQLSHGGGSSAMRVPGAGPGLFVETLGGVLLVLAACVPERSLDRTAGGAHTVETKDGPIGH